MVCPGHVQSEWVAVLRFKYGFLWLQTSCVFLFLFFLCETSTCIVLDQVLSPASVWQILQVLSGGRGRRCIELHTFVWKATVCPAAYSYFPEAQRWFQRLGVVWLLSTLCHLTSLRLTYRARLPHRRLSASASYPLCLHACCLHLPGTVFPKFLYLTVPPLQMSF